MNRIPTCFAIAATLFAAGAAVAAPPVPLLTYSGYLLGPTGEPVTEARTISFRLYDTAEFGTPLYLEEQSVQPNAEGFFVVRIGGVSPLDPRIFDRPLFLGLKVSTDAAEMAPRLALTASAYALSADWTGLTGMPAAFSDGVDDGLPTVAHDATLTGDGAQSLLGVDLSAVQARIATSCGTGQVMRGVSAAGVPDCVTDANAGGTVTSVGATAPLSSSGGTKPVLSMPAASSSVNGYLTATNFAAFAGKENPLTFGSPLSRSGNTVTLPAASAASNGYLKATDWTAFDAKEDPLSVAAPLTRSGTLISIPAASSSVSGYLTATSFNTFNSKENVLSFSVPLTRSGDTVGLPQATSTANGFLSASDWTSFNSRAPGSGSASYIHNQSATAQAANLNISGNATAATMTVNAAGTVVAPFLVAGGNQTKAQFGGAFPMYLGVNSWVGFNAYFNGGFRYGAGAATTGAGEAYYIARGAGRLLFATAPSGTAGELATFTNRMNISTGGVFIGAAEQNAVHKLEVEGGAYTDGGQWFDGSSREYKEDIRPLGDAMAVLDQIGVYRYRYKEGHGRTRTERVGVIAEELPDLVSAPDGKGAPAGGLAALSIGAAKQLKARLESLEAQNRAQAERIDRLERLVRQLASEGR